MRFKVSPLLIVNEIFYSIQGESTHAGRPCVFVRLAYCNLRCSYCDTAYAFNEGSGKNVEEVLSEIRRYSAHLVEVTGGEPLMQPDVHPLMTALCDLGYEVLLETGGSLDIEPVDGRVKRIVDFKCPSSGMAKKNLWRNAGLLRSGDEVKFVIGTREDFDWAVERVREHHLPERVTVLFSPVFGELEPRLLAGWILSLDLPIRMQLQMHKYIWEPTARGV
ncbi:MAG TPA: radical SAM protein [Bacteroidota bacterium]|nr:radical SAM protein [Bacteroidota bacterium]